MCLPSQVVSIDAMELGVGFGKIYETKRSKERKKEKSKKEMRKGRQEERKIGK